MADLFDNYGKGLSSPIQQSEDIVIGGNQTYTNVTRAIYLSTAGTIVLVMKDGGNQTWILAVGWHPIRAVGHVALGSSGCVGKACW